MTTDSKDNKPQLTIRRAAEGDVGDIVRIEQSSFPTPWSAWALRREITQPRRHLYLATLLDQSLVGYIGGQWFLETCHIVTIAVDERHRRQGIGEGMLLTFLRYLAGHGTGNVTLEYRISNHAAARLYGKLGFFPVRRHTRYYHDTGEDAVEMAINDLNKTERRQQLAEFWQQWHKRYSYDAEIIL